MNEDPRLQFDFYLRSRTEQELMKRAEVLLKAIKREGKQQQQQQQQQQQEEKTHVSQWEEEKASLQRDYESLTEAEAKLAEEVKQIDDRIEELQAKVREAHEAQEVQMNQAAIASSDALAREKRKEKPSLRELSLSAPHLFQLVPFLDTLIAGVIGSLQEIVTFLHFQMPFLSYKQLKGFVSAVTQKKGRSTFTLIDSLYDKEKDCVKLDGELEIPAEIRAKCEELGRAARSSSRGVFNAKAWVQAQEVRSLAIRNRLIEFVESHSPVRFEQLTSEEVLKELQLSASEVRLHAHAVLCAVEEVGEEWSMEPRMGSKCGNQRETV